MLAAAAPGINRIYRLYREERLAMRKRRAQVKTPRDRKPGAHLMVEATENTRPFSALQATPHWTSFTINRPTESGGLTRR